jgi:predicted aldo/keto reductase-like oxidoreductase
MPDHLVTAPDRFLLPVAQEKNAGVVAMKVYGHGTITYRSLALRYSLGLPGVSLAILGMKAIEEIEDNVALANQVRPLDEREQEILIGEVRDLVEKDAEQSKQGHSDLFWLHDTTVMGWKQQDEPALVAY